MKKLIYIFLLLAVFPFYLLQSFPLIRLTNYDLTNYPEVKAGFLDYDVNKLLTNNSLVSDFKIIDNGITINPTKIECPPQNPAGSFSGVITIDLGIDATSGLFDLAKAFTGQVINQMPSNPSEFALTSFNELSFLNQEFTSDKTKLISALGNIQNQEGSLWDSGFLFDLTGSIAISVDGKANKNIIFVTDGNGSVDYQRVIDSARANKIKVFVVSVSGTINEQLNQICLQTGGNYFICNSSSLTESVAAAVTSLMLNYKPCEIFWNINSDCQELHDIKIINVRNSDTSEMMISVPQNLQPIIISNPPYLRFSAVLPGLNKTLDLSLTAKNGDVTITELSINNPVFTIEQGGITQPVTLKKGDTRNLKVKFTPLDSALEFGSLNIKTDACAGNTVLITGGFPNAQPKTATLKILEPLPHQVFIVGDSANVVWTGLLPADVVQLEYSTNNGGNWDTLAKNVSGLKYRWYVPDKQSDSCLIRVIQLWPNNIGRTLDLHHKNGVNSANFNADGSLIITACKDSLARIWNSNNGVKIFDLKGHTRPVVWANFDKAEKYAVTASEDKTAILWDAAKGDSLRTFSAHSGFVHSANFSPDGKRIVTAGTDGSCFVWDINTGKITDTVSYNSAALWFAVYSPDGKYIATADNNGRCNIWNVSTHKEEKVFNTMTNSVVSHVSFSPDGKKLAAATWIGKAFVWNFETGDTLFTVEHHDTVLSIVPLTSVNFNYTGELLLTSGINEARMWNGNTGAFIPPPYAEHRSSVQTAVFNFDGTRVLTASWDSTAKIWNLLERALQTGVMDSVFTIARSDIKSEDIEFPPVPVNSVKDSTISRFIVNTSKFPIYINSVKFSGPNASDFMIMKKLSPSKLDTNKAATISIRFKPKDVGKRTALIEILYSGNKLTKVISGIGYDPGLQIVNGNLDFKQVEIGDISDTVMKAVVRNRSDKPIKIVRIRNGGPDNIHFSVVDGTDTLTMNPGDSRNMTFRFIPETVGRRNDVVYIDHNAPGSPSSIMLYGEGILPRIDSVTFTLANIEGSPGDVIELPVAIKNVSSKGLNANITGFKADLSFNSTLLEPIEDFYEGSISGSVRKISFDLPLKIISSDSIIKKVKFRVGLGNDTTSPLKLENIVPAGKGRIVIFDEPAKFTLKGYCQEGGNRLFESESKILLGLISPNPTDVSSEIDFSVIENGFYKLYIIDVNGRVIINLMEKILSPGSYNCLLNTTNIPSGKYFCILETPTRKMSKQIEISK